MKQPWVNTLKGPDLQLVDKVSNLFKTCGSTRILKVNLPGTLKQFSFVYSHSWQACVPHLPEGVLPAVTGWSLSRRRFCSRKPTQSFICIPSLRTTLCPAAACRLQLATPLGKMDPDPLRTAHLLAASEIQVRPHARLFCRGYWTYLHIF